jgi:hypothetical protein
MGGEQAWYRWFRIEEGGGESIMSTYDRLSLYRPKLALKKSGYGGGSLGGGKYGRQLTKEAVSIDEAIRDLDRKIAAGVAAPAFISRLRQQKTALLQARTRIQHRLDMIGISKSQLRGDTERKGDYSTGTPIIHSGATEYLADDQSTSPIVPLPAERIRLEDVTYASRDGQSEFRAMVLAAYDYCCALTGCAVEEVLQAAHIIPYVDARSNIVTNGLCLRADIHLLYDRNLITIDGDGIVAVTSLVECSEYRALHGLEIRKPSAQEDWPDGRLLSVRHQYIATK